MAQKALTIYTPAGTEPHISAQDDAFIRRSLQRRESGILGDLKCVRVSNNTVRLSGGGASNKGYILWVPDGESLDLTVTSGTQGMGRRDLVIAEFKKGGGNTPDSLVFKIASGTASVTPRDPSLVTSDLLQMGDVNQIAVFRIILDGLNISSIERVAQDAGGRGDMGNITSSGAIGDEGGLMVCTLDGGVLGTADELQSRNMIGLPSFKTYSFSKNDTSQSIHYLKNNWAKGNFGIVGNFLVYVNGGEYGSCDSFLCTRTDDLNGAALQIGYGLPNPVYHHLSNGVWTSKQLAFV